MLRRECVSIVGGKFEWPKNLQERLVDGSGESLYGGTVSDLLSGVFQIHQAWEKTQSCYLGKRRLQKVFNKRVPISMANVFQRKKKNVFLLFSDILHTNDQTKIQCRFICAATITSKNLIIFTMGVTIFSGITKKCYNFSENPIQ